MELTTEQRIEQLELQHQIETITKEYRQKNEMAQVTGKTLVYPNQKEAACEILTHYLTGKLLVLLVAQPGTGKTGTVLEILYRLSTHPDSTQCVKTSNIHIISGMNDTEWQKQFKKNMLPSLATNVDHRSVVLKKKDEIASIRNGIIVTDECHIASGMNQTVSHMLVRAGLTDINVVIDRRVRMLDISATPETVGWDIQKSWGDKAAIVKLFPGPSYKGFQVMLDEQRIRQAEPLNSMDAVRNIFRFFENRYSKYSNHTKKYFPMRILKAEWEGNIHSAIVEFGWECITHNSKDKQDDIDKRMSTAPTKHTVILIKGFWRASKRLVRTHVGGSYEQVPDQRDVTSASQGLIARFCDNYEYTGDELNPELRPIHYGDMEAIKLYLNWFSKGCDYKEADYTSSRIKSKNGRIHSVPSKVHETNIENLLEEGTDDVAVDTSIPDHRRVPVIACVSEATPAEIKKIRKQERAKHIVQILKRMYQEDVSKAEFLSVIESSPCFQVSEPRERTTRSYKIHIEDPVKANQNNRPIGVVDCKEELKERTCWQVYIDKYANRLCIQWQVYS